MLVSVCTASPLRLLCSAECCDVAHNKQAEGVQACLLTAHTFVVLIIFDDLHRVRGFAGDKYSPAGAYLFQPLSNVLALLRIRDVFALRPGCGICISDAWSA